MGAGRELKTSLSPTPPAKAGTLQQVTQVGIQMGLEYLHRRLHNLSAQPVLVLCHPYPYHLFHILVWNFLCSNFRLLLLVLSLHITEKSLASSICLPPPCRYLWTFIRSLLSLLFPRLNRPGLLSLFSYGRCSRTFIIFVAFCWTPSRRSLSFFKLGS